MIERTTAPFPSLTTANGQINPQHPCRPIHIV